MSPYVVPDHVLERKFPTVLTPTFWTALTIVPFDTQPKVTPEDDVPAQPSASSEESATSSTSLSWLADLPYVQHDRFYFDDGNIIFLVGGILYRVHRYFFCRDSSEFEHRISRLSTQQEQESSSPSLIPLHDVKPVDFDAFLSILYPLNFNTREECSFEEWTSILDLSTRWGFTSIRDLAIRCLKPPTPLQRLLLARKFGVEEWILPALRELCERPLPLTFDEARLMDVEDIVLVGSVRETVRSHVLAVKSAGIGDCIVAWRSGKPWQRPAEALAAPAANCPEPVRTAEDPISQGDHAELDELDGAAGPSAASGVSWGTPKKKKKKGSCSWQVSRIGF